MLTKLDQDHNDRRTNGICYRTQQVPTDKICNQNLKVLKKEMDYLSTTLHQQSGIHIKGQPNECTTHSTFPPIHKQKSLTTVDSTKHSTKHPSPSFSTAAACTLVINLLKILQKLESTLHEMTQSTTKILAILEQSSNYCLCNKPGISHLGQSTATNTQPSKT